MQLALLDFLQTCWIFNRFAVSIILLRT